MESIEQLENEIFILQKKVRHLRDQEAAALNPQTMLVCFGINHEKQTIKIVVKKKSKMFTEPKQKQFEKYKEKQVGYVFTEFIDLGYVAMKEVWHARNALFQLANELGYIQEPQVDIEDTEE